MEASLENFAKVQDRAEQTEWLSVSAAQVGISSFCEAEATVSRGLAILVSDTVALRAHTLTEPGERFRPKGSMGSVGAVKGECRPLRETALIVVTSKQITDPHLADVLRGTDVAKVIVDRNPVPGGRGCERTEDPALLDRLHTDYPQATVCLQPAVRSPKDYRLREERFPARDAITIVSDVERRSCVYSVRKRSRMPMAQLAELLYAKRDRAGVVYCSDADQAAEVTRLLEPLGMAVASFHTPGNGHLRSALRCRFRNGALSVLAVPTGHGGWIDHPKIDYVLHTRMPPSLDAYVRDTQIATRGTNCAECVIFYGNEDCDFWDAAMSTTRARLHLRRGDLEQMRDYCLSARCRHLEVIKHQKPDFAMPSKPRFRCLSCDVCLAEPLACPDGDDVMLDLP